MKKYDTRRIVDATTEPVTLAEAKDHLRVDIEDDDDYITNLIIAARQKCESYSNRAYLEQTWLMTTTLSSVIKIPILDLISVESITVDGDSFTDYEVDTDIGEITCNSVLSGPTKITFKSGYSIVPQFVKQAILLVVGTLYENRENVVVGAGISMLELPQGAEFLLEIDRVVPI